MMATRLDSKKSVYGWMDEEQYEELWCHVTKNCFCNEFLTVEGQACPDIELVCWRHDKMDKKCDACVLVDYLNPMDISLWRTSLPRLKCNMLRCPHKWVAHSCAECECVCNSEFPPEYHEITEYQEIPMFDDDSLDAVPENNTDKVPFAADILKDCLHGLELIYPKDYEVDEYLHDFCSAKHPDPPYEAPQPAELAPDMEWYVWRPLYRETYRPPAGQVFEDWAPEPTGAWKRKPQAMLCSTSEAVQRYCPLNMGLPDSFWKENMTVTEMYRLALKCPCTQNECSELLLRLRTCMRMKLKVREALKKLLG